MCGRSTSISSHPRLSSRAMRHGHRTLHRDARHERIDQHCDARRFLLQREVPAVEQMHLRIRQVAQVSMRTGLGEKRSEEHTSELQSLMRISYAVFCLKK